MGGGGRCAGGEGVGGAGSDGRAGRARGGGGGAAGEGAGQGGHRGPGARGGRDCRVGAAVRHPRRAGARAGRPHRPAGLRPARRRDGGGQPERDAGRHPLRHRPHRLSARRVLGRFPGEEPRGRSPGEARPGRAARAHERAPALLPLAPRHAAQHADARDALRRRPHIHPRGGPRYPAHPRQVLVRRPDTRRPLPLARHCRLWVCWPVSLARRFAQKISTLLSASFRRQTPATSTLWKIIFQSSR